MLSVCLFIRMISHKSMQLGSPNVTYKSSTMSPGIQFILRSKGQRPRSRVTKTVPPWVIALLCVLASASFQSLLNVTARHLVERWNSCVICRQISRYTVSLIKAHCCLSKSVCVEHSRPQCSPLLNLGNHIGLERLYR